MLITFFYSYILIFYIFFYTYLVDIEKQNFVLEIRRFIKPVPVQNVPMTNPNVYQIEIEVGKAIRAARKEKKMSPKALLYALEEYGISLSEHALISYEVGGRINIPSATLLVIAVILDLDLNSLVTKIKDVLKKV